MDFSQNVFRVIRKEDRLFYPIIRIIAAIDTSVIALASTFDPNFNGALSRTYAFAPRTGGPAFLIETSIPSSSIFQDIEPEELVFRIDTNKYPETTDPIKDTAPQLDLYMRFLIDLAGIQFLSFYERHKRWLLKNISTDCHQWPEIFRFCWLVRNAVGHAGKISWDNPNPKIAPIFWKNIKFSQADNGREILGTDLHLAELISLIFDFSDELDKIDFPI